MNYNKTTISITP